LQELEIGENSVSRGEKEMANSGEKFMYFLIGGFVGASVALLFAPKSGEETRRFLEGKYREGTDTLNRRVAEGRQYVDEVKGGLTEKVGQTIDAGKETVARQKDQLTSAIEAGRKAYQEEKSKLSEESGSEEG
jgi:gas vesicle protein